MGILRQRAASRSAQQASVNGNCILLYSEMLMCAEVEV